MADGKNHVANVFLPEGEDFAKSKACHGGNEIPETRPLVGPRQGEQIGGLVQAEDSSLLRLAREGL
ncbi:MAG TPA: hypothetical protein VMV44_14635 [Rectinemataceae bacterium]|nr:hypothetical protein [Rectinemataceae bacterium]